MQYSKLGNTGLIVSRLSFGAMTFGNDPSIPSVFKVTESDAQAMIDKSLDAGINFFDTADGYSAGQSEEMLGKTLGTRRKEVVIATKAGFRTGNPITQAGLSAATCSFPASKACDAWARTISICTSCTRKIPLRPWKRRWKP